MTVAAKVSPSASSGGFEHLHTGPFEELADVLPAYGGMQDVYVTQNRFYGPRRISNLAQLSAMYSDLDYYRVPAVADMHPRGVLDLAFDALQRAAIPDPSLAVATGRGLALVWRHHPVPPRVLPVWRKCQRCIFEALQHLGANPGAMDAARVLRLVGTHNSRSGTPVEAIWEEPGGWVWDFDGLADEILPLSREEYQEELRARREEERAQTDARRPRKRRGGAGKGSGLRTLNEKRMGDLLRLLHLRGIGKLPPGERDAWMFVAGAVMSYLVEARSLEERLIALGKEKAGWSEAETKSSMQAVISRAEEAADGKKIHWRGQQRDPRYRLTNQEIIRRLAITPEEQERMETIKIVPEESRLHRDRERKEQERRSHGAQPRDEYIADRRERRQHNRRVARDLRRQPGMSLRRIGTILEISHTEVKRLLDSSSNENAADE